MLNCNRDIVEKPIIKKQYRTPEVLEKLGVIFHNKCFLCETKEYKPDNFEIEHLKPHKGNEKLKYDWNNLYLACGGTCNQYKSSFENILAPCNIEHDVEKFIIYELEYIDKRPHFYSSNEKNILIKNTCDLLEKIHNGNNSAAINKTAALREAIRERAVKLLLAIKNYYKAKTNNSNIEKQKNERLIKEIVSRKSPYTMLMRSLAIKDNFKYLFD